jgi:rare lipoprotein A
MRTSPAILLCAGFLSFSPQANSKGEQHLPAMSPQATASSFSGNISWYGKQFQGRKTASGEMFDNAKCTSAHRTLPFFTKVLVEDPKTGNAVIVKVNDRGPFVRSRVMDASMAVARRLKTISQGTTFVDCLIIKDKAER